jgi:Uma2 family endonuclease
VSIPLNKLLTIAEYTAIGESAWGYTELIAGRVLMSPSPTPDHAVALGNLCLQLRDQVPDQFISVINLDVDLELVPADEPGFSRRPDMIIFRREATRRIEHEGGMVRASEVLVVIEIVAADTRRIDQVDKRRDYADAGIPHYWTFDLDRKAAGVFRTEVPFPVEVSLGLLR